MITTLLFDFSRVLLFPLNTSYSGGLNKLHAELKENPAYSFASNFTLNMELLKYLKIIKETYTLYIYTSEDIQNSPEVKPLLDEVFTVIFSAKDIGFSKTDSRGYIFIAERIQSSVTDILFIDDRAENIAAAQLAGLNTLQYQNNDQLFLELEHILS